MLLSEGVKNQEYTVDQILLPVHIEKRLEALGMTKGSGITVLNKKGQGILIVKIRGTRFALGKNITKNIMVGEKL